MYYFIPSWYTSENSWMIDTPYWFRVSESMQFYDSNNQLKMFESAQEDAALILMAYQPQLRYFLHKQDLLHTAYWSFFDDIQNIHRKETQGISFKQLGWPKGISFIYTPFKVLARLGQEHYADIHFAENGNLLQIDFFEQGKESKRFFFDDRGFLSSITYLKEGQVLYRDFLNEFGVWQVREYHFQGTLGLEINPYADKPFLKTNYASWDELLAERLAVFKSQYMTADDKLVVAMDTMHNQRVIANFADYLKIFSFFGDRFDFSDSLELRQVVQAARLLVVDSETTERLLVQGMTDQALPPRELVRLTPFDTRLRLGSSQTIKELIVYFIIDGLDHDSYLQALYRLLDMMELNPLIELHLVTYDRHRSISDLEKEVFSIIETDYTLERFTGVVENQGENNLAEDEEVGLEAIRFFSFTNENQVIQALDKARLVLDLSAKPHLYTQIASISAGVPQVNMVQTEYITHKENGWIASDLEDVCRAISYYFDGLTNWNRSLVYAVQKMGAYTSGELVAKWKELLED